MGQIPRSINTKIRKFFNKLQQGTKGKRKKERMNERRKQIVKAEKQE